MTPGSISLDKEFIFHDGEKGEKFFIVLRHGENGHYVVSKTTSNGMQRGIVFGCQLRDRFPSFFLPKSSTCFIKNTWVCLHEFYELSKKHVLERHFAGQIYKCGEVPLGITKELLTCAIACVDISTSQKTLVTETLRGM